MSDDAPRTRTATRLVAAGALGGLLASAGCQAFAPSDRGRWDDGFPPAPDSPQRGLQGERAGPTTMAPAVPPSAGSGGTNTLPPGPGDAGGLADGGLDAAAPDAAADAAGEDAALPLDAALAPDAAEL